MKFPRSAYDKTGGMVYFARMLDKARLFNKGELPPDYHSHLGKGMDGRCCRYFRVEYAGLVDRAVKGESDEIIFEWCSTQGRRLTEDDIALWNGYLSKRGWKDEASGVLQENKERSGLGSRADIETFFAYFEVDEKRQP